MRLLCMVNYEGRHCNLGGHWDMIRSAMSIKEEQPRGAHPTRDGGMLCQRPHHGPARSPASTHSHRAVVREML